MQVAGASSSNVCAFRIASLYELRISHILNQSNPWKSFQTKLLNKLIVLILEECCSTVLRCWKHEQHNLLTTVENICNANWGLIVMRACTCYSVITQLDLFTSSLSWNWTYYRRNSKVEESCNGIVARKIINKSSTYKLTGNSLIFNFPVLWLHRIWPVHGTPCFNNICTIIIAETKETSQLPPS